MLPVWFMLSLLLLNILGLVVLCLGQILTFSIVEKLSPVQAGWGRDVPATPPQGVQPGESFLPPASWPEGREMAVEHNDTIHVTYIVDRTVGVVVEEISDSQLRLEHRDYLMDRSRYWLKLNPEMYRSYVEGLKFNTGDR